MYVLAINKIVNKFPYSIDDLRKDNTNISFPLNPDNETLAEFNVFMVVLTGAEYDMKTQVATQEGCVYNTDKQRWETAWVIRDKTQEEILNEEASRKAMLEEQRSKAYRNESDPVFFKYQRGEATQQDWLDKIADIKARYPD
jgi:hypothetical protein